MPCKQCGRAAMMGKCARCKVKDTPIVHYDRRSWTAKSREAAKEQRLLGSALREAARAA